MAENIGKPLADRVLLKIESGDSKSDGGIYIQSSAQDVVEATVVAVSDGFIGQNGEKIELELKEGDRVLVGSAEAGQKVRINKEKYNIVRESEILMKLNN